MKQWERDSRLRRFLAYVKEGKPIPADLLEFVAGGVDEFLKGGKPWQVKTGRRTFGEIREQELQALQAFSMANCGFSLDRIAEVLGLIAADGRDYRKTLRRHIRYGGQFAAVVNTGRFNLLFAVDELLLTESITKAEAIEIQTYRDEISAEDPEDYPL